MHIRQWVPVDHDIKSVLVALSDANASVWNSLFRPDWRPEPVPCIPDDEMPYTLQDGRGRGRPRRTEV